MNYYHIFQRYVIYFTDSIVQQTTTKLFISECLLKYATPCGGTAQVPVFWKTEMVLSCL
jgi:hypothetical protein